MTTWIIGIAGAVALGVATNVIYDLIKYQTIRFPRVLTVRQALPEAARNHDIERDGLLALISWSPARRLVPGRLETTLVGRMNRIHLFSDSAAWAERVELQRAAGAAGRTGYLVSLTIDHGEHPAAHNCRMAIAESDYAESLATSEMFRNDPEQRLRLHSALDQGLEAFFSVVPPTSLSISVSVISRSGRMLLLRRSRSVKTFQAQWTVGINETFKYSDEPGNLEDLYSLVGRGLQEELALKPADYGPIVMSWLGWSDVAGCFAAVALVRTQLSEAEVDSRRQTGHSVYEHDLEAWYPLRRKNVSDIVLGRPCPDGSNRWSYLAPLVALESWRWRGYL